MGFFGLVHSRRDADACTPACTRSSPGQWLFRLSTPRANIDTRTRLHPSTAHAQWEGLRWLQLPVKNGKVVGLLYRCWRQLITSSLFFCKAKSNIHTPGQKSIFRTKFWMKYSSYVTKYYDHRL